MVPEESVLMSGFLRMTLEKELETSLARNMSTLGDTVGYLLSFQ